MTTGTASGSPSPSRCRCSTRSRASPPRALFLYPMKALAQDQARWLARLGRAPCDPRSTTATRPSGSARMSGAPRTRSRRTRTCCTSALLPRPRPLGRGPRQPARCGGRRGRTCTAACSARTSGTSSDGCAGWRSRTAASRVFVLATATIANAGELASRADRARRSARHHGHVAARRAARWCSGTHRCSTGAGHAREPHSRDAQQAPGGARRPWPQGDLLHEEPEAADSSIASPSDRLDAETAQTACPVPRRVHAGAAPRDRAAARRGRAAGRDRDRRARARHRHRLAATRDLRSGFRGRWRCCGSNGDAPGGGHVASAARRERGRARPVLRRRPAGAPRAKRGGGPARPSDAPDLDATFSPPRTNWPLTAADAEILCPEALQRAALLPELRETPRATCWRGRDTPAARISLRSATRRRS